MYNEIFMKEAVELARKSLETGVGGPFGAVVVQNGIIIGKGSNAVVPLNDPTAHAEIMAIREACRQLDSFQLKGCELYTSCEPCPMCLSAIYWAHLDAIYYAASRQDAANAGFDDAFLYKEIVLPLEQRALQTDNIILDDTEKPFLAWKNNNEKIEY